MPYLFTPPTQQVSVPSRHPLWRRTTDTVGRSVLKVGDQQYQLVDDPSNEQIAACVLPYIGGHTYYISDLEGNDLIAAGYGAYLVAVFGGAYGRGTYGDGAYGIGSNGADPSAVYPANTYDGRG